MCRPAACCASARISKRITARRASVPRSSGTPYFNSDYLDGPFGFYFFVGAQGRAVARNLFLDGNTFEDSRSVDSKALVGDLSGGLSMFWGNAVRLDAVVTYRTEEFEDQDKATPSSPASI